MAGLFDAFPDLQSEEISISKMTESDVNDLMEITENERVYRFIPSFLYRKSKGNLLAAIRNMGGRDFEKHKTVIPGIYWNSSRKLIGFFEVFDYRKRSGTVTIGYRLNESDWNRGIATTACRMMTMYLSQMEDLKRLIAYVMPENVASAKVLLSSGFQKTPYTKEASGWGGRDSVTLDIYEYIIRHEN